MEMNTEEVLETCFKWLVQELRTEGYECKRIIIFCRLINHVSTLYRLFCKEFPNLKDSQMRPWAMYHSTTDDELKSRIVANFSEENGFLKMIFSSTAFGLGLIQLP